MLSSIDDMQIFPITSPSQSEESLEDADAARKYYIDYNTYIILFSAEMSPRIPMIC